MTTNLISERRRPNGLGGYSAPACHAGFVILAEPCGGEHPDSRVFNRQPDGNGGTDYRSHRMKLATREGGRTAYRSGAPLAILVSHGGGHERLDLPNFYDGGAFAAALLAMPEGVQYAALYTMWSAARDVGEKARETTAQEYAAAFVEGRLKKSRVKQGRRTVTIEPPAPIPVEA